MLNRTVKVGHILTVWGAWKGSCWLLKKTQAYRDFADQCVIAANKIIVNEHIDRGESHKVVMGKVVTPNREHWLWRVMEWVDKE